MVNVQRQREQAFAECLEAVQSGSASLEQALEGHPNEREQLEPLLRLALRLPSTPTPQPTAEFRLRARMALQAEIAHRPSRSRWAEAIGSLVRPSPRLGMIMSARAAVAALLVAVLVGGTAGVTYAAQGSLPGATLYPVKLASERGVMATKRSPESKARYHIALAERRADEVLDLSNRGENVDREAALAVAHHLDSAISLAQELPEERAQTILKDSARELAVRQVALAQSLGPSASQSQASLSEVELYLRRGQVIASALAEDASHLSTVEPIARMREAEIAGPVSNLSPLRIGNVEVAVALDARLEGVLELGGVAEVKGVMLGDGRLLASRIEVKERRETMTVDLQGAISSMDPLVIAGHIVTVSWDTEVKGALITGLKARVKGTLLDDGAIAASKIEAERVKAESKLQGVVGSVGPLTVGGTVVMVAPGAEVEGSLEAGAVASVKGRFLENGQFLALELKLSAPQPVTDIRTPPIPPQPPLFRSGGTQEKKKDEEERNISGRITQIGPGTVTVTAEDGSTFDLQLAPGVRIKLDNGDKDTPVELRTGLVVDVKFDPTTGVAARIEVEGPADDGSAPAAVPTPGNTEGSGKGEAASSNEGRTEEPSQPKGGDGATSGGSQEQGGSGSSQTGSGTGSGSQTSAEQPQKAEPVEIKIEGVIVTVDGAILTVDDSEGQRHTLRITSETEVRWDEPSDSETGLQVGDRIEAKFDQASGDAYRIEVEKRLSAGGNAGPGSGSGPSSGTSGSSPSEATVENQGSVLSPGDGTGAVAVGTEGQQAQLLVVTVKGMLTGYEGDEIRCEDSTGRVYVAHITAKTLFKSLTSQPFSGLRTGQKVEVKFDSVTGAAIEIRQ